jgi:hypothetical protein
MTMAFTAPPPFVILLQAVRPGRHRHPRERGNRCGFSAGSPAGRVESATMQEVHAMRSTTRRLAILACVLLAALAAAQASAAASLDVYRGLATWVDIYDEGVWRDPEGAVAAIADRGVRTVYLETSNYRQRSAIRRSAFVARFLEAAHASSINVVAWYLPGFLKPAKDVSRSLAAIDFRTPAGDRFDGFALDIEATAVRSPAVRTRRLLRVARDLRAAVGPAYAVGAIILSPRGLELSPAIWPGFPYAGLAEQFDVFLPMVYFTYRTQTRRETRHYVEESIAVLRREVGDSDVPIHVIGGVADRARPGQVRAFVDAVCADRLLGASLYDFATTSGSRWSQLRRVTGCTES